MYCFQYIFQIQAFIVISILNFGQAQIFDGKPHAVAQNLKKDLQKLKVIYEKFILHQEFDYNLQSGENLPIMVDILEDLNLMNKTQINDNLIFNNNTQISQTTNYTNVNNQVFYVLKRKILIGNQVQLLLQINQDKDFYINVYNTFIKCVKITISCRDESFLDLVAIDINDDLRFQYKNPNFEQKGDQDFNISLSNFAIQISKYDEPFNLKIFRKSTDILLFNMDQRFIMSDKFIHLKYQASSQYLFGLGERNYKFKLEFNNSAYTLWNRDSPQDLETATATGGHNTYGSHPIYLMKDTDPKQDRKDHLSDTNFHLVYLQNVNAMDIFLTKDREIEYRITGGILDFKIITCDTPKVCVQRYNRFLGKQALMPLWAYGFHQSRWGYKDIYEVKQVIEEYNTIEFPVESVFLDIDYMINYNTFTVNETNFPLNDKSIMQDFEKRIVPILDVAIGLEIKNLKVRNDAINQNIGIKDIDGGIYIGRVWPGFTLFPDFEKPITRAYWQNYTATFMQQYNISAFWLDMNEYANFCHGICEGKEQQMIYFLIKIFDQKIELNVNYRYLYNLDVELLVEGLPYLPGNRTLESMSLSLISIHEQSGNLEFNAHNINGYMHSQSTYKALKYRMQNPLPFLISRSSIPGSGNYVAHWAGDNNSSYQFMAYSVASLFNFYIFGIDFSGSDICGFMNNTSEQLCNRWGQLGSLYPFSRNHNHEKLLSQEFFTFEEYGGALHSFRQKYSLLKYYYTLTLNNTYKIQPAFMNYPEESFLYLDSILETHIMVGNNILSVPILTQDQFSYSIYFPKGRWYNISDGRMYENTSNQTQSFSNYFNQAIDLFMKEGHLLFQQHDRVLSSTQLNNRYHLKCGMSTNSPYICEGIIMSINKFDEKNVHLKCTQPFICLYQISLEYLNSSGIQKLTLKLKYLDDVQFNQPESIYFDSITIYSEIFNQINFNNTRKIFKNNQIYRNYFEVSNLNHSLGLKILTRLHILYDSIFEIYL